MPDKSELIWLFFRTSGRVNRMAYFLSGLLVALAQVFPLYRFTLVAEGTRESEVWAMLFLIAFVASLWSNIALAVKRLHDFGKPGMAAIMLFVPIVSFVALFVLCLFPGNPGPNQYGTRTNARA